MIRDSGSTNGIKINGKRIGKKWQKVRDGDIIGFARYEFAFIFPGSLYDMLKGT